MDDLIAFLNARLDERAAKANAAAASEPPHPWTPGPVGAAWTATGGLVVGDTDLWDCEDAGSLCMSDECAEHVAANDPEFALADVAAKRRIIELVIGAYAGYAVLPLLALPFSGHPDFREEWRQR